MRIEENAPKTFETVDFAVASFLLAKDIPLIGLRTTSIPRKFAFVFQETSELQSLITNFWSGTETVEPLKLLNAEKELRRRLHSDTYQVLPNEGRVC